MGSAFLTFMAVALGINYGWQPDPGGGEGAIQYIIQVSPDRLDRLEKIGEITATIDPSIQGRVTQVVVRIGSGPVPKIAPPLDPNALHHGSSADHSPLPIPEMALAGSASPIAGLDPNRKTSLMKPDANGFAIPSSLSGAAEQARGDIRNSATNAFRNTAQNAGDQLNQAAQNGIANVFGGNSNERANSNTRPDGRTLVPPPSPNPGALTFASNGQPGGPSTDPSDRDDTYRKYSERERQIANQRGALAMPNTGGTQASPFRNERSNDLRSQTPTIAQSGGRTASGLTSGGLSIGNPATGPYPNSGRYEMVGPPEPADLNRSNTGMGSFADSRQSNTMMPNTMAPTNLGNNQGLNNTGFGRIPESLRSLASQNETRPTSAGVDSRMRETSRSPYGSSAPGYSNTSGSRSTAPGTRTLGPDPQLDQDQLAAGGWSVSGGRLYDRYNQEIGADAVEQERRRRLDQEFAARERAQRDRYPDDQGYQDDPRYDRYANGYEDGPSRLASRDSRSPTGLVRDELDPRLANPSRRAAALDYPMLAPASRYSNQYEDARRSTSDLYPETQPVRRGQEAVAARLPSRIAEAGLTSGIAAIDRGVNGLQDVVSPSDRSSPRGPASEYSAADMEDSRRARVTHTTGPLVHGILLFSAIANFYLFLWLRNMRIRYRDLVTSRRVAEAAV